jgi:hypothetical protein
MFRIKFTKYFSYLRQFSSGRPTFLLESQASQTIPYGNSLAMGKRVAIVQHGISFHGVTNGMAKV